MVLKAEAASPSTVYRCTRGKDGWRHLGRAEGPDKLGGCISLSCKDFQANCRYAHPYKPSVRAFVRVVSPIGRVFDTVYRDAGSIDLR